MRHEVHTAPLTITVQKRKPHRFSICFTLLLFLGMAPAAHGGGGDVNSPWPVVNGLADKQNATATAVDSEGNMFVTGFHNAGTSFSYHTVKFNADGSAAWTAEPVAGQAAAIVVDGDNNIIVTGFVINGTNKDILTVKYCNNPNPAKCDTKDPGEKIWEHTFNGAAGGNDAGASIAVDSNRNVYVAGYSHNSSGNDDYIILKYDPLPESGTTGKLLWPVPATYSGPANNADHALAIAADTNGVAVTGYSENAATTDIETVKFDPAGNQLWAKRYAATGSSAGKQVKMDGSGNVIVAGSATNGSATDIYIVKYASADGELVWEKAPDTTPGVNRAPYGLQLDTAYDVYVVGGTLTIAGSNDIFTAKFKGTSDTGTTATPAWPQAQTFNSDNGNDDLPAAIAVDSGGVYVTGFTAISDHSDILTLKYTKETGVLLWHKVNSIVEGKDARSVGINLSPLTGEVLVGGWSDTAANDYDYFVIKYDQGVLNAPTSLAAVATSQTSLDITWQDNSEDESGFELKRCADQEMTTECATIPVPPHTGTGTVTHSDTGLTKNSYYYYQVLAYKNGTPTLYSNYSDTVQALTVFVAPAAPAWSYTYNGPAEADDYAVAIAAGQDNNPVATGTRTGSSSAFDYYTVKLARTDKSVLWSDPYDDVNSLDDEATCVAVGGDNGVTVSGNSMLYNGESDSVNSLYTMGYSAGGSATALHDQYNGPVTNGAVNDKAVASAVDADNNVVVVGNGLNAPAPGGNNDIYVVKYGPGGGDPLWAATPFDGAGHGNDLPTAVALRADGSIFVSGYTGKAAPNAGKSNFFAAKYSAAGVKIWAYEYSATADGDNKASSVAVDANGDPYVTGYITNATGNKDFYTVKFDGASNSSTAIVKWALAYDNASVHGDDQAVVVMVDPFNDPYDGNIVVAGTTLSGTGDHDITILRYDQAGNRNWAYTLRRPAYDDYAKALGLDSQGNIFIAANSSKSGITHSLGLKFDYQGNYLGATGYNTDPASLLSDESRAITVNSLSEAFVAGFKNNPTADKDFLVYKIAADTSAPLRPYTFTATQLNTSVVLNWQDNTTVKNGFSIQKQDGTCSSSNSNSWTDVANPEASATSYPDSGLNPGSTFCYRIRTTQSSGAKSRWNYLTASTPIISPPVLPPLTAVDTNTIKLDWTESLASETGFSIERSSGPCPFTTLDAGFPVTRDANIHTYTDGTATAATAAEGVAQYCYRVRATGTPTPPWPSDYSSSQTGSPEPIILPAMTAATAISEARIDLTWVKSTNTDVTGQQIYRCSGASNCTPTLLTTVPAILPVGQTTYSDTTVVSGNTYYYQVHAIKTGKWDRASLNTVNAAPLSISPPVLLPPTPIDTNTIKLDWTETLAGETGFKIERCSGSSCDFSTLDAGFPVTRDANIHTYTDATTNSGTASEGIAYRYRVQATGTPIPPWPSSFSTQPGSPVPITLPSMTAATAISESRIDLTWAKSTNTDVTGQQIYRCSGEGCTPVLLVTIPAILPVSQTTYSDTTVVSGNTYYYQVHAIKTGKWDRASLNTVNAAPLSITPPVLLPPTPIDTNTIKLDWTEILASEAGFNIERCSGSSCDFTTLDAGFPVTRDANIHTYTDVTTNSGTASEGIAYRYRVQATGSPTPPWPSSFSTQPGSPVPITLPSMTAATAISEARIDLTWVKSTNTDVTGQQIYRCSGEGCTPVLLTTVPAILPVSQTTYSDTTVVSGNTYYYQVHAIKTGKWDRASLNTVNAAPLSITPPVLLPPTPVDTNSIKLDWTETLDSETGFSIERSSGPCPFTTLDAGFPVTRDANIHTYTDGTATAATAAEGVAQYCYRVRATGTPTPPWPSDYSSSQTGSPKPIILPAMTAATAISESRIDLTWTKSTNTDVTGQQIYRCSGEGCTPVLLVTIPAILPVSQTTYSDTTVVSGNTYYYQVHAIKTGKWDRASLNTVNAAPLSITPPVLLPPTPVDTNSIKLDWTETLDSETGFSIERSSGPCPFTTLDAGFPVTRDANIHTYTDGTATAATASEGVAQYCYRVRATGTPTPPWPSDYSSSQTGSPKPIILPAMTAANAISEARIDLAWSYTPAASSDMTGQQIYRCMDASNCTPTLLTTVPAILPPNQSTYIDTNVSTGHIYYYQVHAIKTGKWDRASLNTANASTVLSGPTDMSCTTTAANSTQVICTWRDTTTSETGFTLERCTGAVCPDDPQTVAFYSFNNSLEDTSGSGLNLTGSTPTYEDGGLMLTTTTSYQSPVTSHLDTDSYTIEFDFKMRAVTPSSPATWYRVFQFKPPGTDRSPGIWMESLGRAMFTWQHDNVTYSGASALGSTGINGAQFNLNTWYHIKGVKNGGNFKVYIDNSTTPVAEVTNVANPKMPGSSPLYFGGAPITLKNFKITNNFKVTTAVPATDVAGNTATITYTDTTPLNGKQYTYKVRATKSTAPAWDSAYSSTFTVSTTAAAAPGNVQATRISEAEIKVAWDPTTSPDVSGYRVERCMGDAAACPATNNALFTQPGPDLPNTQTIYYDNGALAPNTTYTYRVKAFKTTSGSNGWTMTSGTASAPTTLIAPNLTASAINSAQIDLAWNKATVSETNFEVLRCENAGTGCSNFERIGPLLPANTLKYSDTEVLPSTTYVYKIRAVNEGLSYNGGSAWTKRVKLSITDFLPDYQTKLVVPLASVTDMKSDFSDMRFLDADTGFELPYWIESKSASSATVWFKTGQTNNIYLYYGNPNAASASNITNTFIFGDDFSGDTSKWDLGGAQPPDMTLENGQAHITRPPPACHDVWIPPDPYYGGGGYWYHYCDSTPPYYVATKDSFAMSSGLQIEADLQLNTGTVASSVSQILTGPPAISISFYDDGYGTQLYYFRSDVLTHRCDTYTDYYTGEPITYCGDYSSQGYGTVGPGPVNTLQPSNITITPTFTKSTYMGDPVRFDIATPADYQFKLRFNVAGGHTGITIANVKIRKYAAIEPTVTLQGVQTVAAGFANTWSIESAPASAGTPALEVPEELACSADNTTQIYCHWLDKTPAETGFKIERCKVGLVGSGGSCDFSTLDPGFPVLVGANQQAYTDTTASHSTVYKYRVYATRNIEPQWDTGHSNEASVTTGVAAAPDPFQLVAVSAAEIDLTWTKRTTDETGYRIERCAAVPPATSCTNFSPLPDILPQNAASFNNTGLTASTDYCYRVRVFKTATPGGWDLPSSSFCDRTFPGTPANFEAIPLNSFTIKLQWEDISPDEDGYKIEKQTWNGNWVPYVTVPADKTTFIDTACNDPLNTYKYRMKIFRGGDESAYSEATATTPGYTQNDGICR